MLFRLVYFVLSIVSNFVRSKIFVCPRLFVGFPTSGARIVVSPPDAADYPLVFGYASVMNLTLLSLISPV